MSGLSRLAAATTNPASAGPTKRVVFIRKELRAMALVRSLGLTSDGISAW
jgi:hypothetical protein